MWTRTAPLAIVQRQSIKMWHLSNRKWQTHYPRNINNAQAGAEHRFRFWWRINKTQQLLTAASRSRSAFYSFLITLRQGGPNPLRGPAPDQIAWHISEAALRSRTVRTPLVGAKLFQRLLCQQQGVICSATSKLTHLRERESFAMAFRVIVELARAKESCLAQIYSTHTL